MITRDFSSALLAQTKHFPAVLLCGARQVGKTTLLKKLFGKTHSYVLLEDPDMRNLAKNDSKSFLDRFKAPLIIDEFQHAPELVNYLQGHIDKNRKSKGQFILTGSQNFQMMSQVTQSLAGRIGIFELYGLSSNELPLKKNNFTQKEAVAELIMRGTYPELWEDTKIPTSSWMGSYVQTFLERDLRQLAQVGDLVTFEKFLKVAALRTGQIVNYSDMAADCGASSTTIQKWISILERAFVIKLVMPYMANISSRIRKAPKLYFMDSGIATYLMGFRDARALVDGPFFGPLFENLVYSDFIKRHTNLGEIPDHYYLQTKSKVGVDFIVEQNQKLSLYEVKSNSTYHNNLTHQLTLTAKELKKVESLNLVMLTSEEYQTKVEGFTLNIKKWSGLA